MRTMVKISDSDSVIPIAVTNVLFFLKKVNTTLNIIGGNFFGEKLQNILQVTKIFPDKNFT